MDAHTVPAPLAAALLDAGYRVGGPAGVGGGGPVWTAVRVGAARPGRAGADDGKPGADRGPGAVARVVVQVLTPPDAGAAARLAARLEALWTLDHPHLPEVVAVVPLPAEAVGAAGPRSRAVGEVWAVLLAEVPGATVAALLAARGRLSPGEVVTLTVPVAGALDALHRSGLVHGDVSPANLVVRPDGRPVLIDVLGGAGDASDGPNVPRGTPGFTAPEVVAGGARAGGGGPAQGDGLPAAAPADVFALAAVALAALDLAEHDGRLGEELRAACAPEPVRRPTAAELAAALYACADPEPIGQPDAGVLARTALAQLAEPSRTVSVPTGARHRAGHRRRDRARRRLAAAGVAAVVAASGMAWAAVDAGEPRGSRVSRSVPDEETSADRAGPGPVTATGGAPTGPPTPAAPTTPVPDPADDVRPSPDRPDPVDAAVALTRHRVAVLASGDPVRLDEVLLPGSAAHRADRALMDRLAAFGVTLDGVAAVVEGAGLVGSEAGPATQVTAADAAAVEVRVRSALTAHARRSPSGTTEVPAEPVRAVVLRLGWTDDGWRVAEVRPG